MPSARRVPNSGLWLAVKPNWQLVAQAHLTACLCPRVLRRARDGVATLQDCLLPVPTADIVLLGMTAEPFHLRWRFLFDSLSADQRTWPEMQGHCFRTLIVNHSRVIDFYHSACAPYALE